MSDEYTVGMYDDIIGLTHHVSEAHPQMLMRDRAAQFSPFAALTGYGAVIHETGRITEPKIELGDDEIEELNRKLNILSKRIDEHPSVTATYFKPDVRKDGGAYLTVSGKIKKLDKYTRSIFFDSGLKIPIEDIFEIGFPVDESSVIE